MLHVLLSVTWSMQIQSEIYAACRPGISKTDYKCFENYKLVKSILGQWV